MKKIVYSFTIILTALLSSANLMAQLQPAYDTVDVLLENDVEKFGYVDIENNTSVSVEWKWKLIATDFDFTNWDIQFCECTSCYTNEFGALPDSMNCTTLDAGRIQEWKFGVKSSTADMVEAFYSAEIIDLTNNTSDTVTWITSEYNGIDQLAGVDAYFKFYPTVFSDEAYIVSSLKKSMNVQVNVYDLMGKQVLSKNTSVSSGDQLLPLSLGDLNSGLYIVQVSDVKSNEVLFSTKAIKN